MTDPELDGEFKKKLDAVYFDYEPASWDRFEEKRRLALQAGRRRRTLAILLTSALILMVAGLALWKRAAIPAPHAPISGRQGKAVKVPAASPVSASSRPAAPARKSLLSSWPEILTAATSAISPSSGRPVRFPVAGRAGGRYGSRAGGRRRSFLFPGRVRGLEMEPESNLQLIQHAGLGVAVPDKPELSPVEIQPLAALSGKNTGAKAGRQAGGKLKKKGLVSSYSKRWILGLSIAPENNSPAFNPSKGTIGLSLGAAAGWNFSPRLTAWAGMAYSVKIYKEALLLPENPGAMPASTRLEANCRVLEFPLGLTYTLYNGQRSRFYVGAGISTYLMQKETYAFYTGNQANASYNETLYNKNRNILNVVEVQAGYQLKFSRSLSIGVQPFIKVPARGIGEHQYKDISTGAALILNFNLKADK